MVEDRKIEFVPVTKAELDGKGNVYYLLDEMGSSVSPIPVKLRWAVIKENTINDGK